LAGFVDAIASGAVEALCRLLTAFFLTVTHSVANNTSKGTNKYILQI
jgi:hypothetical protein